MAQVSLSGESLSGFIDYFNAGGLISSGFVASNAFPASKLKYEKLTGVASAGTPVSAAHTLGSVPSIVIPVCRTSGGSVATTGTHTSTAILGIVSDVASGATFEVYVFA